MMVMKSQKNLLLIIGFVLILISSGLFLYYTNKPIFEYNIIKDDFEDQITGIFPMGWLSGVNPFNVRVVKDGSNKVMEVKSAGSKEVTEIARRFKRTSEGIIECKIKALDTKSRFVIHIPQLDREYNPFDDIIIVFLEESIYVIQEKNIKELDDDPSFWEKLILLNDDMSWAIDEQSLENDDAIEEYETNIWYSIRIDFTRESFLLAINGNPLGVFNYPKYNPPYFASLYFIAMATPRNFKFYVDNIEITLSQPVDYMHPANIFLLVLIPIFVIGFYYFKFSKKGKTTTKRLKKY